MFNFGFSELLVILVVALLVLGPQRLPEVARVLGRTTAQLRRMFDEFRHDMSMADFDYELSQRRVEGPAEAQEKAVSNEQTKESEHSEPSSTPEPTDSSSSQ